MDTLIPWGMLTEMLSSQSANIDKRIGLAEEQLNLYLGRAERLQRTIKLLKEKKKQGE